MAQLPIVVHAEPLGLVLSGGGAKGAYEVGVWQTLVEKGLASHVRANSGTSVGAINAALFATVNAPAKCAVLWEGEIGSIFQFNTNLVVKMLGEDGKAKIERAYAAMGQNIQDDCEFEAKLRNCSVSDLPADVVSDIRNKCESVARKRLFFQLPKLETLVKMLNDFDDSKPIDGFLPMSTLHSLIKRELSAKWPRKAPAAYATAVCKDGVVFSAVRFELAKAPLERRVSMICASACIPFIFGMLEIDGKTYVDGGYELKGGDNVPLAPILENHPEIKTAIIVYLDHDKDPLTKKRIERNRETAEERDVKLVEITPSRRIGGLFGWGGVFDASPDTARRLMELGRKDAERVLRDGKLIQ